MDQAVGVASQVLARYDGTLDEDFDFQIATALRKRAEIFLKLGRLDERDGDEALSRFGSQQFGPIAPQVDHVRSIKQQILMTATVKAAPELGHELIKRGFPLWRGVIQGSAMSPDDHAPVRTP